MKKLLPILALSALLAPVAISSAQAGVRTGTLTCDVAGGPGYVIASAKQVTCRFTNFNGDTELYNGTVHKFGVDLGVTGSARVVWAVFEPTIHRGSLAGNYSGVSAEATVGAGVGANVLVGGGNGGVTLQPVSIQGQTGLNIAAGIGNLDIALVQTPVYTSKHHHHKHHGHHHKGHGHHHKGHHHHKAKHHHHG